MLTVLFYHASCFSWLFTFNSWSYCTSFNPIVELVIFIRIASKEAKAEMELHPVPAEAYISKCSIWFKVVQIFFMLLTHQFTLLHLFTKTIFCLCFLQPCFQSKYVLQVKPRIFNISIDCSALNRFSTLFSHLLQIIERTAIIERMFFSKMYGLLGLLNFLYLPQKTFFSS